MTAAPSPRLSIVIPAHNAESSLGACLTALRHAAPAGTEILVVDDGSTDRTAQTARDAGAVVLSRDAAGGPAVARNFGVRRASAGLVLFVDADVVVAADAVTRVLDAFAADPELAAVFGSYDSAPSGGTLVSDYRNLLHHFVHQSSREDSRSFWAGCGAVRRGVFLSVGGFDERFHRPSIEDIELGGRLAAAGHRIRLDPQLLARHLKRWTLVQMIRVDVRDRAYPWARLILRQGRIPDDLNLRHAHRASAVLVWLAAGSLAGLLAGWPPGWQPGFALLGVVAVAGVAVLNRAFHAFVWKQRGARFALGAFLLHALYYAYASATFGWAWLRHAGPFSASARALR